MRKVSAILMVVIVATALTLFPRTTTASDTGFGWTKYSGNPLNLGAGQLSRPWVIYDGEMYKMWYTILAPGEPAEKIHFADSSDGVNWATHGVVLEGTSGSWDEIVYKPVVLYDGTMYKMWYLGNRMSPHFPITVGYATSSDGISWTKYAGNPVLVPGGNGGWDDFTISTITVLFDGTQYVMWYSAEDYGAGTTRMGVATSTDGTSWTKYSRNPVLVPGPNEWDDGHVWAGPVIRNGNHYEMWYTGQRRPYPGRIGLAMSSDGFSWSKYENNPVLENGPSGSWDSMTIVSSCVVEKGSNLLMWYYGSDGETSRIGLATSYSSLLGLETIVSFESITVKRTWDNPLCMFTVQQNFDIALGGSETHRYWAQNVILGWQVAKGYILAIGVFEIYASDDGGLTWRKIVPLHNFIPQIPKQLKSPLSLRSTIDGDTLVMKNDFRQFSYVLPSGSYISTAGATTPDPEIVIVGPPSASERLPGTATFVEPTRGHVDTYARLGSFDGIWLHCINYPATTGTGEKSINMKWYSNGDFGIQDGSTEKGIFFYPDYSGSAVLPP